MKRQDYTVATITSDGEELLEDNVNACSSRDAAGKVFGKLGCDGVQTIFVSNDDEAVQYQQVGRTLRAV